MPVGLLVHRGDPVGERGDTDNGTAYGETLRAYLDALGEVMLVAKQVHVRRNTLRYRIKRLCELVDLDLDDPTERLVAQCHLRLRQERA